VRWVGRDGKQVISRLLNQDTYRLQVIDGGGQLLSQPKDELREFEVMSASPMPVYEGRLSTQELADVVAYLKTLKGSIQ
jgi:mono/diheme cytochrome c family protein